MATRGSITNGRPMDSKSWTSMWVPTGGAVLVLEDMPEEYCLEAFVLGQYRTVEKVT